MVDKKEEVKEMPKVEAPRTPSKEEQLVGAFNMSLGVINRELNILYKAVQEIVKEK